MPWISENFWGIRMPSPGAYPKGGGKVFARWHFASHQTIFFNSSPFWCVFMQNSSDCFSLCSPIQINYLLFKFIFNSSKTLNSFFNSNSKSSPFLFRFLASFAPPPSVHFPFLLIISAWPSLTFVCTAPGTRWQYARPLRRRCFPLRHPLHRLVSKLMLFLL